MDNQTIALAKLALKVLDEQSIYFNRDKSREQLRKCQALEKKLRLNALHFAADHPADPGPPPFTGDLFQPNQNPTNTHNTQ